jgi:hypothetical protein
MFTFETQIYALGVYWHIEVSYSAFPEEPDTNTPERIEIEDLWILGAYPEGCESPADYESVRYRADIGYLENQEQQELIRRCRIDLFKHSQEMDYEA